MEQYFLEQIAQKSIKYLSLYNTGKNLVEPVTLDRAVSVGVVHILSKMTYIYTKRTTWSDENQKANILKIAPNSYGAVLLSSKARAHKLLISERNQGHKVRVICRTYEISLYCLARPKVVLSVSVYRVPTVVYTYKVSWLETLLLNNGEIYNV